VVGLLIGRSLEFSDTLNVSANRKYQLTVLSQILDVIPDAAAIVDVDMTVLARSFNCVSLGLVQGDAISHKPIFELVADARKSKDSISADFEIPRRGSKTGVWDARIRVFSLSNGLSLLIAQDQSEENRLNTVRRDFVANVSHELKTPVGALSLLAEAAQAADSDVEQVRHFTSRMQIETRRLAELIGDLVELSQVQSDAPLRNASPVTVKNVVNEAIDAMQIPADHKKIQIHVNSETDDEIAIFGDEGQLVTALRNLLMNAINYSPNNTHVTVKFEQRGDFAEVSVTDQGPGISDEDQNRIFERFYRVDPARSRETGGTGLGLSIVKHVCANHGGEVSVKSTLGQGSTFKLKFPLYYSNPEVIAK
jgi:two-component system sensor histidine kinase SenX3